MKYLHLIWAALFRRKTRTVLTLLSVMSAFLLFGLLDGVRVAFNAGGTAAGVNRLIVSSKFSLIQKLPQSLLPRIQAVPGVSKVTWSDWLGGYYQDPKNQLALIAIGPDFFDIHPDYVLSQEAREAFERTRTAVLMGNTLAQRFNLKVGGKLPITGSIYPNKATGETSWNYDIVGVFRAKTAKERGIEQQMFVRWDYFDEANSYSSHEVGWIIVQVADANRSDQIARQIDAISANSAHETRTQTEQAFTLAFAKQLGDIGLIVSAIMGAVFFTLLLLTGNTMAQAVRERIPELATLKTLGFTDASVLWLVLGESIMLVVFGGVIGLALGSMLMPIVSNASGGAIQLPPIGATTWAVGVALMILIGAVVGAIPASRAMRLKIVDALAGR